MRIPERRHIWVSALRFSKITAGLLEETRLDETNVQFTPIVKWLNYTNSGRIHNTRFVALKVSLREGFNTRLPASKCYTPAMVLQEHPKLKLIIDLTFTTKYYNGKKEFEDKGVRYVKLKCKGKEIPSEEIFQQFVSIVEEFIGNSPEDYLIGVHCTHGVNRTGYLIVRYMIERLGYTSEIALQGVDWYRLVSVRLDHGVGPRGSCSQWRHTLLTCWMLFTLYTLPQLAVSAKLLCLLMVVICGAVPSMVRSVKLFGESSNKFVRINMSGHVYAADYNEKDAYLNLTIRSIDFRSRLNIYSEHAGRYLCFNKSWKLVGMRDKRKKGAMCEFLETVEARGYSRYRSIANATHFLAFNSKGKPLRYNPRLSMGYEENCINFVKIDVSFNITRHNSKLAGGINQVPDLMRWYYKDSSHARRHKGRKRKA